MRHCPATGQSLHAHAAWYTALALTVRPSMLPTQTVSLSAQALNGVRPMWSPLYLPDLRAQMLCPLVGVPVVGLVLAGPVAMFTGWLNVTLTVSPASILPATPPFVKPIDLTT